MTNITDHSPAELLVDVNVRRDLQLTKEFIGSIKQHGVLMPIVAVATDDGLRVRMGHRRVAAAIEAGLETVPVITIDTTNEGDAAEIDRLLTQHAENHHRAGLTTTEDIAVAHQLSLLGMKSTTIAKRTNTKRADVETALSVGQSELATEAANRYELTLDQAAVVAEFEDDTETVTALIAAAKEGKFAHVAQTARDRRAEAESKAPIIAELTTQNITVIERPTYNDEATLLNRLRTNEGEHLDPDQHVKCEGHAVCLESVEVYTEPNGTVLDVDRWGYIEQWPEGHEPADEDEAQARIQACTVTTEWIPEPVCTAPPEHGHITDSEWWNRRDSGKKPAAELTETEREERKAARKLVIENNKAWKSAREVRHAWIKNYLTRKTLPATAGQFIAQTLVANPRLVEDLDAHQIAAEWLAATPADYGRSPALLKITDNANDKRALVIALGVVLAGHEADSGDGAWRRDGQQSATGHYLRFLQTLGYELSDVEDYAASSKTA